MLILQAITTRYFGPGNVRGSKIKAKAYAGSVSVPYDHSLGIEANHAKAAEALANKYKWAGKWYAGGMPEGSGYCFVCTEAGPGRHAFTVKA